MSEVREQFADLVFPLAGIHIASEFATPPPNTTRQALNVRANDSQQRLRGGSRNGLEKYIPGMVAGPNLIQDLNIVVYTDPIALLTAVDSLADFLDPSTNNDAAGYGVRNPDPDGQGPRYVRTGGSGISQNRHVRTARKPLLIITPRNQVKVVGATFSFNGNEFTSSGLHPGDDVVLVTLTSTGADAGAGIGNYAINASNAVGTGLSKYTIQYHQGNMSVQPGGNWGTLVGQLWSYRFFLAPSPTTFSMDFRDTGGGGLSLSAGDTLMICFTILADHVVYPTSVSDNFGNGFSKLGSVITRPGHDTKSMWGMIVPTDEANVIIKFDVEAGSGQIDVNSELWSGGDGVTFPPNMDTPCV
jgi:hypothetical protein